MGHKELRIQGGTIVTAYGSGRADLWVSRGKIVRVAKDTLEKKRWTQAGESVEERFDASGYYVLPGFVALTHMQVNPYRSTSAYLEAIRAIVKKGHTYMLDTLSLESWMADEQVLYQKTPHYNNVIDYSIQIALEQDQFYAQRIRQLCKQGFRIFQLILRKADALDRLNWDEFVPLINQYRPAVNLYIPDDAPILPEERRELVHLWLSDCREAKVRTCVNGGIPPEWHQEPFYHLSLIHGNQCNKVFEFLEKHWFLPLPTLAQLDQIRLDVTKRAWNPDILLSLIVRLSSTNIAKAIGRYPFKGSVTPGADADLLLIKKEDLLTKMDVSTILNFSEICLPTFVMSNGKWIYKNGQYAPVIGSGRCLFDLKPYNYVI